MISKRLTKHKIWYIMLTVKEEIYRIKKGKFIFVFAVLFVVFTMIGTVAVNAAEKIVFKDNSNPDFESVLSLKNDEYTIEINEETKVGYVVKANDNSIIELGTCKVTVVDYDNRDVYVLCYDIEENSLGEMVITISDGVSTVTSLNGEIESIIELNTTAEIVE